MRELLTTGGSPFRGSWDVSSRRRCDPFLLSYCMLEYDELEDVHFNHRASKGPAGTVESITSIYTRSASKSNREHVIIRNTHSRKPPLETVYLVYQW